MFRRHFIVTCISGSQESLKGLNIDSATTIITQMDHIGNGTDLQRLVVNVY